MTDDTESPELLTSEQLADMIRVYEGVRPLPVPLTPDELERRALEVADLHAELSGLKATEDARRKAFNDQHKERVAIHNALNRTVHERAEEQEIRCVTALDLPANRRIVVRLDTLAVVSEQAMTADERERAMQMPLIPEPEGEIEAPAFEGEGESWDADEPEDLEELSDAELDAAMP